MGARGPKPRPRNLKLLHGETRPSRVNYNEPVPPQGELEPPDWLPDDVRAIWDRTVRILDVMGVVTPADVDALVVYCQAVAHYTQTAKLIEASSLLVRGKDGQIVKNPLMAVLRDQATLLVKLAGEFGLTPSARTGLTGGDAVNPSLSPERLLS